MRGLRGRSATTVLIVATALLSIPFLAIGTVALFLMPVQLWLVGGLYAAAVLLATRPIRIHPDADLSPSADATRAGRDRDGRRGGGGGGGGPDGAGRKEDSRRVEAAQQPEMERHEEERKRTEGEGRE